MSEPILDFRLLIATLAQAFKGREFDAREASSIMMNRLFSVLQSASASLLRLQPAGAPALNLMGRFGTKMISNDLRRLYTMGLLRRRWVKRECRTRSGKACFRGYEYKYSISNQGRNYLKYLEDPEAAQRTESKDLDDILWKLWIERHVPPDERDLALATDQILFQRKRRGFQRFSTWQSRFWTKLMEARDSEIAQLEKRAKELEEENRSIRTAPHIHKAMFGDEELRKGAAGSGAIENRDKDAEGAEIAHIANSVHGEKAAINAKVSTPQPPPPSPKQIAGASPSPLFPADFASRIRKELQEIDEMKDLFGIKERAGSGEIDIDAAKKRLEGLGYKIKGPVTPEEVEKRMDKKIKELEASMAQREANIRKQIEEELKVKEKNQEMVVTFGMTLLEGVMSLFGKESGSAALEALRGMIKAARAQ